MLFELIRKEALSHLLSARFQIVVALVVVLMAAGAVTFNLEYGRRLDDFNANENTRITNLGDVAQWEGPLCQVYSYYDQPIMARPGALGFISEGHERDLPNVIRVNAFRVQNPVVRQRGNAMLPAFNTLDWSLIVSMVLSFAALVMSFDGFAGEKEDGTLRLILSGAVPRWYLVVTKLIGAWSVLTIAFLIGTVVQLIIILPSGWLQLDGDLLARLALAFILVMLFVAVFILLGLLISACHARATAALVVSLLIWTLLVVVIPRSTVLLASKLQTIESFDQVNARAEAELDRVQEEYLRLHPKPENEWVSGHWSPQESLDLARQLWLAHDAHFERWRASQLRQVELTRRVGWISPATWLASGLEQISGTGIDAYHRFLFSAERYRDALHEQLRSLYPVDPVNAPGRDVELVEQVNGVQVDVSLLPLFSHSGRPLGEALMVGIRYGSALLVLAMLLLLAAAVATLRYDVR